MTRPLRCPDCLRLFLARSGYTQHRNSQHCHQSPSQPAPRIKYHPHLNGTLCQPISFSLLLILCVAQPCNEDGTYLPTGSPPTPRPSTDGYAPFENRASFEFADLLYKKVQLSSGHINTLLQIWNAHCIVQGGGSAPFESVQHLHDVIDSIQVGDAPWEAFELRYSGPVDHASPQWKRESYYIYARNTHTVAQNMLGSRDFRDKFDYAAFEERNLSGKRKWSNLMSGTWAWRQSVCAHRLYSSAFKFILFTDRNFAHCTSIVWCYVCTSHLRNGQDNCFCRNRPKRLSPRIYVSW
jgi:hypothetical protein